MTKGRKRSGVEVAMVHFLDGIGGERAHGSHCMERDVHSSGIGQLARLDKLSKT